MSSAAVRALASACLALATWSAPAARLLADDRSTERFRYLCSNDLGRRDVTLFANGTVRLREGLWDSQEMYLDELTPEELESALRRLQEIGAEELAGVSRPPETIGGEWVERCELHVALADTAAWSLAFSPYEIPPLVAANLIHLAEDLAALTHPPKPAERLPAGYRPQPGQVLRTADGERFEIVRWTLDRRGVELTGLDSPVQIFVALDELDEAFVALEVPGVRRSDRPLEDALAGDQPVRGMTVDADGDDDDDDDSEGRGSGGGGPGSRGPASRPGRR